MKETLHATTYTLPTYRWTELYTTEVVQTPYHFQIKLIYKYIAIFFQNKHEQKEPWLQKLCSTTKNVFH